jgi:hypothetical protein
MKTNIHQYSAVRVVHGLSERVGRGFVIVGGVLFTAFFALLRTGIKDDSGQNNNSISFPGSYRWPHDTPSDVHDYNS